MVRTTEYLENELKTVYQNLTNTQGRCNELLEECRQLKREKKQLQNVIDRLIATAPAEMDE